MADTYTVKSGDTLSKIAKDYGVSVSDISGYKSGNPNLIYPGEVLNLSNVGSSINASNIKPPVNMSLPSSSTQQSSGSSSLFSNEGSVNSQVDKYRKQLEKTINSKMKEVEKELADKRAVEKDTLGNMKDLTTPFREDLENTERERLYINENFEANQSLINELDTLLTEGNNLIRQQQQVTGLAAVRNPRIQQTMNDVAARAGVIEAVINVRNNQIGVAENLIDRSVNAIAADRLDQLNYYNTVLELNRQDILSLDSESKKLADYQVALIENDLRRAEETADYIKKLMIDPATATLMGEANVSLNDSVDTINSKIQQAQYNREVREFSNEITLQGGVAVVDPSTVPQNQLVSYKDGAGNVHYYKMPIKSSGSGGSSLIESSDPRVQAWVQAVRNGAADLNQVPSDLRTSVAAALGGSGMDITFDQYLGAAQETAGMSFSENLVSQLKSQYDTMVGSYNYGTSGSDINAEDWVSAIVNGYATLNQVPDELKGQVMRALPNLSE